jgi:5-formyltetrahydrofolate cyclo-ligase
MSKRLIRTRFLTERRERQLESCINSSAEIQRRLLRSELFHRAGCLSLYSAIHNEVQTDTVFARAFEAGKTLAYPRVKNDGLEFVDVQSLTELAVGAFGVLEPQGAKLVPVEELDIVVVPGVAFDRTGHRLGYGRGFYDRALSACRKDSVKVGFAYDSQLLDELPSAKHDQRLSALMTETCTLNFTA